jgi:hypothetical protein
MVSVFDELSAKARQNENRSARDGARRDLGLLLFSERDAIADLWKAAERCVVLLDAAAAGDLRQAMEKLRPLFGPRA